MATKPAATEQVTTREIPALSLRAAFRPDSVDREKRTAELIFSTGARVRRGFWDPFDEELSLDPKDVRMDRLASGRAPLLDSHGGYSLSGQIGVVETASVDGKEGRATVRFSKRADVEPIFQDVVDGIIRNVSVGYRVHKYERVQEGDAQKSGNVPVYRAVDWEPYEVSLVPMPADAGAGVRSAEGGAAPMPCTFVCRIEERAMDPKVSTDPTTTPATQQPANDSPAKPPDGTRAVPEAAARAAAEAATRAERERADGVRELVRRAARSMPAAGLGDDFADQLVRDGVSIDRARAMVLDKLATEDEKVRTDNHVRVEMGTTAEAKRMRGMEAAILHRAGFVPLIKQAKERGGDVAERLAGAELDPGEYRGISLMAAARELIEARGTRTVRMSNGQVFEALVRGGYQTTADFATLFENVMHKAILAAFAIQPDTWRKFCGTDRVPDFRDSHRYRTGALDVLDPLTEHGEFKNKSIPDGERQSINTATKGNIYAISRQTFINDDMGALNDLFMAMGRAAARTLEEDVYALLNQNNGLGPTQADGQPLFHANRKNVNATGAALAVAAIDADRVVMLKQKDITDREYLDLRPAVLLVPTGLGSQAKQINSMEFSGESSKFQVPNVVRGLFREVVDSPRLVSATRRYLFADPTLHPLIKVVFLEESGEAPVLSSQEGWRVEGVEYKVRIDAKAQVFEPKAAVTNAGA